MPEQDEEPQAPQQADKPRRSVVADFVLVLSVANAAFWAVQTFTEPVRELRLLWAVFAAVASGLVIVTALICLRVARGPAKPSARAEEGREADGTDATDSGGEADG